LGNENFGFQIAERGIELKTMGKTNINQLRDEAIQLGATMAKIIPVSSIVIDERVRLKCLVPLCDKYNQNLMCPPPSSYGR
jgi:predicted metal-binding protein